MLQWVDCLAPEHPSPPSLRGQWCSWNGSSPPPAVAEPQLSFSETGPALTAQGMTHPKGSKVFRLLSFHKSYTATLQTQTSWPSHLCLLHWLDCSVTPHVKGRVPACLHGVTRTTNLSLSSTVTRHSGLWDSARAGSVPSLCLLPWRFSISPKEPIP